VSIGRVLAAVVLYGMSAAAGAQSTASVRVTARVLPRLAVHLAPPAALQVSQLDVERGYVDAQAPFSVTGNLPGRVPLAVTMSGGPAHQVQVFSPQGTMEVRSQGALFDLQAFARGEQTALTFRFRLAADTRPGSYPWPVTIALAP
jgi:hypothetical protein